MPSARALKRLHKGGGQESWETMLKGLGDGNVEDKLATAANTLTAHFRAHTEPTRSGYRLHSSTARLHGGLGQAVDLHG